MAFDNLGNIVHFLHDAVKLCGVLEVEAYVGAGVVAYFGWVDEVACADEDAKGGEALHALVDGGS